MDFSSFNHLWIVTHRLFNSCFFGLILMKKKGDAKQFSYFFKYSSFFHIFDNHWDTSTKTINVSHVIKIFHQKMIPYSRIAYFNFFQCKCICYFTWRCNFNSVAEYIYCCLSIYNWIVPMTNCVYKRFPDYSARYKNFFFSFQLYYSWSPWQENIYKRCRIINYFRQSPDNLFFINYIISNILSFENSSFNRALR